MVTSGYAMAVLFGFGYLIISTARGVESAKKNKDSLSQELYTSVVDALYDKSIAVTRSLEQTDQGDSIKHVVQELLDNGIRNTISYGYRLWEEDGREIIIEYFPKEFKLIFNYDEVNLVNKKYDLPLKVDANTNSGGQRAVWGDGANSSSHRLRWSLLPTWENNRVTFYIKNLERFMFLKLNNVLDSVGDRTVLGDVIGSTPNQYLWALEPLHKSGSLVFHVINQEYGLGLKLSDHVDSIEDRQALGYNGSPYTNNQSLQWYITGSSPSILLSENSTPNSPYQLSNELYNAIVSNSYKQALIVTSNLYKYDKSSLKLTVQKLLTNKIKNIVQYAYRLWISERKDIVIDIFPKPFKFIFNEDDIKIISTKHHIPLKIDVNTDGDGDRLVWGDKGHREEHRYRWRLESIYINEQVLFKIKNIERSMYLKLNYKPDNIGDRKAWGDVLHVNSDRLTWALEPYSINNEISFFIINQEFKQNLKLAYATDSYGDRLVWGHNGEYKDNPVYFGWTIQESSPRIRSNVMSEIEKEMLLTQDLYNAVSQGLFDKAITITNNLLQNSNEQSVVKAVNILLTDGVRNTISYAYQLWTRGHRDAVINHFPMIFKLILNGDQVKIVNKAYGLPLKLDVNTDGDGDRPVWGDALDVATRRLTWNFSPIWEHNRVHFKIKNLERSMFLKLNYKPDSIGDRAAWGNTLNIGENRLTWSLEAQFIDSQLTFFIFNQEFGLALKMAVSTDRYGDRSVWGHNGVPYEHYKCMWHIFY